MNTTSIIKHIIDKPAMYFGNRDGYVRDIEALDIGFVIGASYPNTTVSTQPLLPVAFKQHIIDRLAPDKFDPPWPSVIREHAIGEREEWELFKRLWKDYEKRMAI